MTQRVSTGRVGVLDRVWFRRLGIPVPAGIGYSYWPVPAQLARLVPYPWRWWHHTVAVGLGFFWRPCPLCRREFGGHEAGLSIQLPNNEPGTRTMVCSRCTRRERTTDWARDDADRVKDTYFIEKRCRDS